MPSRSLARPIMGLALLDSALAVLTAPGTGGAFGTVLDQGRGVPWGGVLTVLGGWAQALLA